jgi:serine/threonine protein kinase
MRPGEDQLTRQHSSRNYEKISKIGEGTYGVVYKVRELASRQVLALKKIRFDDKEDSIPCTAIREISILKMVSHENVVKLYKVDFDFQTRKLYLFFEYLDLDLQKLIEEDQMTYGYVRSLSEQLLRGILYLHERRVIHRDIKPHNLLVCQKSGTLKIADFGLARPYCLPLGVLTPEIQTLWYRSPELLLGSQTYSMAVDIWAAGCVIAEMILGKPLFCEKSEIGQLFVIFKIMGTPGKDHPLTSHPHFSNQFPQFAKGGLRDILKEVDERLVSLLEGLLDLDQESRLSAADALKSSYFF